MAISLFDQLCTIVWYKTVAMALNAQNPNAVATKIDELRAKDYADRGVSTPPSFDVKSFAPYANGKTTPSKATLHLVDSLLASSVANTAYTFTNGPFREAAVITIGGERHVRYGVTELWTALAGTEIGLRTILEHYNKDIRKMQVYGHADVLDLALKLVESPRELRRLHTLRRWSHEQQEVQPFFPRGTRTRRSDGARTQGRVPLTVGLH